MEGFLYDQKNYKQYFSRDTENQQLRERISEMQERIDNLEKALDDETATSNGRLEIIQDLMSKKSTFTANLDIIICICAAINIFTLVAIYIMRNT